MIGLCIVGHGAPPLDFPPDRLRALFAGHDHTAEIPGAVSDLEREVRSWPRTPRNDPYKAGVDEVAAQVRALGYRLVEVAFNEFCDPTVDRAIASLASQGAGSIVVVSTMLMSGGKHAEEDIATSVERAQRAHPTIPITYAWPYDKGDVARFLATHAERSVHASSLH